MVSAVSGHDDRVTRFQVKVLLPVLRVCGQQPVADGCDRLLLGGAQLAARGSRLHERKASAWLRP
jgi:hypothetical protein